MRIILAYVKAEHPAVGQASVLRVGRVLQAVKSWHERSDLETDQFLNSYQTWTCKWVPSLAAGRNQRSHNLLQRGLGAESRVSAVENLYLENCFTQIFGAPLKLGHLKSNHVLNSKVPKWQQNLIQKLACYMYVWRKAHPNSFKFLFVCLIVLTPSGGLRNSSPGSS